VWKVLTPKQKMEVGQIYQNKIDNEANKK
jgi:Spy/CpxP family protein refolding chaperone